MSSILVFSPLDSLVIYPHPHVYTLVHILSVILPWLGLTHSYRDKRELVAIVFCVLHI